MENCETLLTEIKNNTQATKENTLVIANILKFFYKYIVGSDYA